MIRTIVRDIVKNFTFRSMLSSFSLLMFRLHLGCVCIKCKTSSCICRCLPGKRRMDEQGKCINNAQHKVNKI